jgi:hypothetical protein
MTLQKILQDIPGEIEIHHVKGHQDKKKQKNRRTWQEQLNIIADHLATKAKYRVYNKRQQQNLLLDPAEAYLLIGKKPVTRAYKDNINSALTSPELRKHMLKKYGWKTTIPDMINWELGGLIYAKMDKYAQRFATRYIYQRLPLHGASFQQHPTKICPLCKREPETFAHFNECKANKETWSDFIPTLTQVYNKYDVDPALRLLINLAIVKENPQEVMNTHALQWDDYRTLIQEQTKIGWSQIKLGRYSNQWTWHQYRYASQYDKHSTQYGYIK